MVVRRVGYLSSMSEEYADQTILPLSNPSENNTVLVLQELHNSYKIIMQCSVENNEMEDL